MHGTPCALSSPVTGRNGLQIGRHAFGIPGLTDAQSDELLSWLLRFAADEPSRVYYHQWEVGDLVVRFKGNTQFGLSAWSHLRWPLEQVWDNRRMLHRACPYPPNEARIFHGNRIGGDASEAALNVDDLLPGLEQLQRQLERMKANPELVRKELQLRAHFDEQMSTLALPRSQQPASRL